MGGLERTAAKSGRCGGREHIAHPAGILGAAPARVQRHFIISRWGHFSVVRATHKDESGTVMTFPFPSDLVPCRWPRPMAGTSLPNRLNELLP